MFDLTHSLALSDHEIPAPMPPYDYLIAANGIFLRADSPHVSACLTLTRPRQAVRGLKPWANCLLLHIPRVSAFMLSMILDEATRYPNQELLFRVSDKPDPNDISALWLTDSIHYCSIPEQDGTTASVLCEHPAPPGTFLELHTHSTLRAFFSATDDADEQEFRFYAVLGNLDQPRPTFALRLGIYGYHFPMPMHTLFAPDSAALVHDLFATR